MADDVKDWHTKLTEAERNLLTQIFRFFVQADIAVSNCYHKHYARVFKPTEIQMMLAAFSNAESIHVFSYAYLLDTIGMPDSEFSAFMNYQEMQDKFDFYSRFGTKTPEDIATTLAVFGAFTEGLQLFASFCILMNFPRFNKMKGMGQIVSWSVRDEQVHCTGIIKLFHAFLKEHPNVWTTAFQQRLYDACTTIVMNEDRFVDLAFAMGPVDGLTAQDVKTYIRWVADRRLIQLGLKPMWKGTSNPLPWMDEIMNGVEHANFFESRATEYSKAATEGNWGEVFA